MDTISDMIETGKKLKAQAEAQQKAEAQAQAEAAARAASEKLEKIRALFPEAVRPYVILYDWPRTWLGVYLIIQPPDLAPIYAMAQDRAGESSLEKVTFENEYGAYGARGSFLVAHPYVAEVEDGVCGVVYETIRSPHLAETDDINVALALAEESARQYIELLPVAEERNRATAKLESTPLEDESFRDPAYDLQRINDLLTDAECQKKTDVAQMLVLTAQARALVALCDRIDRLMSGEKRVSVDIADAVQIIQG